MNTNYSVNQPAFTAKLKLSNINLDTKKFKQVEEAFSRMTQHYKDDVFEIKSVTIKGSDFKPFKSIDYLANDNWVDNTIYSSRLKKWFNNASVNEIAGSFARLFQINKIEKKSDMQTEILKKKLVKNLKDYINNGENYTEKEVTAYKKNGLKSLDKMEKLSNKEYLAKEQILNFDSNMPIDTPFHRRLVIYKLNK